MQVRVGDKISRGQVVAKCGNSGNSTVPHLHFQLTDGPLVSHAASLPAYFTSVVKEGATQASVLPLSGDRLTPSSAKATAAAPAADHSSEARN
jgi:murein DD-endopeptidase MepM/ murein hydrolase activator NlpD